MIRPCILFQRGVIGKYAVSPGVFHHETPCGGVKRGDGGGAFRFKPTLFRMTQALSGFVTQGEGMAMKSQRPEYD